MFSRVTALFCIPTDSVQEFPSSNIYLFFFFLFLIKATLTDVR